MLLMGQIGYTLFVADPPRTRPGMFGWVVRATVVRPRLGAWLKLGLGLGLRSGQG